MVNCLSLSGQVFTAPKWTKSPSNIEHCWFWLSHTSEKNEAGLRRKIKCKIPVQMSGLPLVEKARSIKVGSNIHIQGFLATHKSIKGIEQWVLHAEKFEFIN